MAKLNRVFLLIVMTLLATVVPAVYQKGVQPRVEATNCKITIMALDLVDEETTPGKVVFKAYLRIENDANVPVTLSRLDLDVYHHSITASRYRWIGTLNTSAEYIIPANGYIQSYFDEQHDPIFDVSNPENPTERSANAYITSADNQQFVYGKLVLTQDESQGTGTTEAMAELIETGFLSVIFKGVAKVGPFEFPYERDETIAIDLWDPQFMITDVFNYYRSPQLDDMPEYNPLKNDTDSNVFVIRAKMHNPSTIPMVIMNYSFDLKDAYGNLIAKGMPVDNLVKVYDPDYIQTGSRRNLIDVYLGGDSATYLPAINKVERKDEWQDIIFVFNFTDTNPLYANNPELPDATTKDRITWFMNELFMDPQLHYNNELLNLEGKFTLLIGTRKDKENRGIIIDVGGENSDNNFKMKDCKFYQYPESMGYNYTNYLVEKPVSLMSLLTVGEMNVSSIDINRTSNDVNFDMNATLTFTNPYRLDFNITNLATNYYRANPGALEDLSDLASGVTSSAEKLTIGRAEVLNPTAEPGTDNFTIQIQPTTTKIPHKIALSYNTYDYLDTGISKMLQDLGIDPILLNLTDPLWLLGPEGMGNKTQIDPSVLLEYLIKNGIDPLLMMKEMNVSTTYYYGDDAYYPLRCSFFGTNPEYNYNNVLVEDYDLDPTTKSGDFPTGPSNYNPGAKYYIPEELSSSWTESYTLVGKNVQYEIVRNNLNSPNNWEYVGDEDIPYKFNGFISEDLSQFDVGSVGLNYYPGNDKLIWRIYASSSSDFWGYAYDAEEYLRNWYMVHGPTTGDVMFRQNFTIDTSKIHSIDEIDNALLSISYRYPAGGATTKSARFGIGIWNVDDNAFEYQGEASGTDYELIPGTGILGYQCYDPTQSADTYQNWKFRTVNVTDVVKQAYQNYLDHGANDSRWLNVEVSFSMLGSTYTYVDDVVLQIDYHNQKEEPFRLKDLFRYLQQEDPVQGNAFNFLDDINFDPVKFMSYIESDLGITPEDNNLGANFTHYLRGTDTRLDRIMEMMETLDYLKDMGAGEPLSFLDMLNYTKYIIDDNPNNNVDTPYGPRTIVHPDGYVIEDPYVATKSIIDALSDDIFVDEYGNIKSYSGYSNPYGKELWMMFENLKLYLPWIVVYLFMHGWSKDDIFDAFEALGLMKEVKDNYISDIVSTSYGMVRESMLYSQTITLDFLNLPVVLFEDYPLNLTASFSDPITDDKLKFYQYVNQQGTREVLHTIGPIVPYLVITMENSFEGYVPVPLLPDIHFTGTSHTEMALQEYEVRVWIENNPGSRIAPPGPSDGSNPYLNIGSTYKGFNDQGSKAITHYLRQSIDFNGAPLMEIPGDFLGLTQFLDDYFFTAPVEYSYGGQTHNEFDYTSYTLLNYFDVSAKDFIELVTGYDQFSGQFDPNGDGLANDWSAPVGPKDEGGYNWLASSLDEVPRDDNSLPLRAWGTNPQDDRIYFDDSLDQGVTMDDPPQYNGKVIWTDSPELLDNNFAGDITNVDGFPDQPDQDFTKGAPPIINLIDMLVWLSETTGAISSKTLFDWIIGRQTYDKYIMPNPSLYNDIYPIDGYDHGIGLQKTWGMLEDGTFNATGMVNWLGDVRGSDPYGLFYTLNNWYYGLENNAPDPQQLFFYIQNPNFIQRPDGSIAFIYHDGLGTTDNEISHENFWKMFNGSWWAENGGIESYWDTSDPWNTLPGLIFERIRQLELEQIAAGKTGANLTFNYFQMLENLKILPDDWLNVLQGYGIKPLELLGLYDSLNFTLLLKNARDLDKKTLVMINGTFRLNIYGLNLYDQNHNNTIQYSIAVSDYTARENLHDFIDPSIFYNEYGTFAIYS